MLNGVSLRSVGWVSRATSADPPLQAVVPLWGLSNCSDSSQPKAAVEAGLCSLQSFVASQQFAQTGGDWANCVCSTPSCVSNSSSVYPGYHYL